MLCYLSWSVVSFTDDDDDDGIDGDGDDDDVLYMLLPSSILNYQSFIHPVYYSLLIWMHCLLYIMTVLDISSVALTHSHLIIRTLLG